MTLKVALIAGEASGDQLGAHLMVGFRTLCPTVDFMGVGGTMMAAEGLQSLFAMEELSVMGFQEVLPRLPGLLRRKRQVVEAVAAFAPDVLVTIDSPDFCLRVAKDLKRLSTDIPIAHYVAPSVWAWRPERAKKMAERVDHVLALLPFEPPYMTEAGVSCDFVGHPVAALPKISATEISKFRSERGISQTGKLLCLLPGSRSGELSRHGPVFAQSVVRLLNEFPDRQVTLPVAAPIASQVIDYAKGLPFPVHLVDPTAMSSDDAIQARLTAYAASDVALAVSGTVSLELASQSTPMLIAWDASWLTRAIVKRKFRLDTATLVNLVSETRAVPELFFDDVNPSKIVPALSQILTDPQSRSAQADAAAITMDALGRGQESGGVRAAQSVLRRFGLP